MGRLKGSKNKTFYKFTADEINYLREIAPGRSREEMTQLMNEMFDYPFSLQQVINVCDRYQIKNGRRSGRYVWTDEEKEYLRSIVAGRSYKEIAQLMREKFDYEFTVLQVKKACHRYKILNEIDMTFKSSPDGSESIDQKGYIKIKINGKWRFKHKVIWEEVNGPLPEGSHLLFADGDKTNLDLDNLILVTKRELFTMSRQNLITEDMELTKTGLNVAKLMIQTQKMQKRLKQG